MDSKVRTAQLDGAALCLSALCIIHCLALPTLSVLLPVLASVAEAEWVHKTFVLFAVPIALIALFQVIRTDIAILFGVLASIGLGLLIAGAFVESFHDYETPLTVAGAVFLAVAHVLRWRRFRA